MMIWFCFDSSSIAVDDTKYKNLEKHVKLSLNFNSIFISQNLEHSLYHVQAGKFTELTFVGHL